ncbi:hypothetical protein [Streptomyces sp. NPDC102360]|uniref:hypothetical protein n=1 Tax=Streptomyces sp. NPDC102360 TaxID=3366160 RepID=UPI0037F213BC
MSVRTRFVAGAAGIILLGSAAPALADDLPSGTSDTQVVDGSVVADGAAVEPGSVTDTPPSVDGALEGTDVADEFMEEDAEIPGEVETDGAPDPVFTGSDDLSSPTGQYCGSPFNFVHISKNKKNTMSVKYRTFVTNNTSSSKDFKFTSKKSGSTTLGASVTIGTEFKAMWLAKVRADITASAQRSWTSELGVEVGGKVKAHSTVNGKYGIKKEKVYGYTATAYSNCTVGNKRYMTVWAPYKEGWVLS